MEKQFNPTDPLTPVPEAAAAIPEPAVDLALAKKHFSLLGLGTFVILAAAQLAVFPVAALANLLWPGWAAHDWGLWIVNYIPLYLIAVPLGLLVFRLVPKAAPAVRRLKPGYLAVVTLICFFLMYAGNFAGILLTGLLQLIPGVTAVNPVAAMISSTALLPRALIVVVAAPLIEEYLFRKVLIDRMGVYGQKTAVVVSAALFGLFHGNLSQFFYAFALGLVFGYVYITSGKLRYSVGMHMLINFLGGVFAPMLLEGIPITEEGLLEMEALTAALPWLVGLILYAFSLVGLSLAGLVLLCVYRKKIVFAPAPLELPGSSRLRTVWCNVGMILSIAGCLVMIGISLFA